MSNPTQWRHDDLQHDLADHLRGAGDRIIWENMQLGPSGSPRPDVFSMPKSYSKFCPLAYEIKISTADFRRDVTSGKWQSYLKFASGVIFAVPAGLVTKEDIPKGCGLIVRHENVWRAAKAPTLHHIESLPHDAWMKLMIDGLHRASYVPEARSLNKYAVEAKIRKQYGDEIAVALSNMNRAVASLQYAEQKAKTTAQEIEEIRKAALESARRESLMIDNARRELCVALGIPPDADHYTITARCKKLARQLNESEEIVRLRRLFDRMRDAIVESGEQVKLPDDNPGPLLTEHVGMELL
jgi:hypothetical protein